MIKLDQGAAEPVAKRNTLAFAQIIELPKSMPDSDLKTSHPCSNMSMEDSKVIGNGAHRGADGATTDRPHDF